MNTVDRTSGGTPTAPLVRLGATGPRARHARALLQRATAQLGDPGAWRRASQNGTIRRFTSNLARYLTEGVPDIHGARPLLVGCMDEALKEWGTAARGGHPSRHPLLGYMRGALYRLPEALEWEVGWTPADGERSVWEPLESTVSAWWSGTPALVARRRDRPQDTAYVGLCPADFRLIVLVRFLWCRPLALRALGTGLDDLVCRFG